MATPTLELIAFAEDKVRNLELAIKQTAFADIRDELKKELELVLIALRVLKLPIG